MRAWSAIVASGPCLIVNLSAERGKQVLPNRQYLHRLPIHAEDGPPIRWWRVRGDDSAAELRRGHHARFRNSRAAFPAWWWPPAHLDRGRGIRRGSSLAQPHAWMHHARRLRPVAQCKVARPIRWVSAIDILRIEERAGPRVCSYRRTTEAPVRRRNVL